MNPQTKLDHLGSAVGEQGKLSSYTKVEGAPAEQEKTCYKRYIPSRPSFYLETTLLRAIN